MADPQEPNDRERKQSESEFQPRSAGSREPRGGAGGGHHGPGERHYTLSISDKDRQTSFDIEDKRWERGEQIKDWLKLAGMVAIVLLYHLVVYFLEPGLR